MSVTTHCECCEHNRRLVERYRKPIPDGGRTWQERAAVLKVKYVDADEQLRGAVAALEEARALIETAEQDGYVSAGWREDARSWQASLVRRGGQS